MNILLSFKSLFESGVDLSIKNVALVICTAILSGVIIALTYLFTHKNEGYLPSIPVVLVLLPVIVSVIIMLVGTNVAAAFAIGGVFFLVRFRSAQIEAKDLTYIFSTVGVALCYGMGYILYGALLTVILVLILIVLFYTHFGEPKKSNMKLRILVPENINYENAFDDIFEKYGIKYNLDKVKTSEFGSVFELIYRVDMPKGVSSKELIDELRTRNGNLNILLTLRDNYYTREA